MGTDPAGLNDTRARLFDRLASLGIVTTTIAYPAHRTVDEGKSLRGDLAGAFTKNLLLKDKKGKLFLVVAAEDQEVDLKTLHTRIGAQGRLGFAAADQMRSRLGVEPGALTPLALVNAASGEVRVVVDESLRGAAQLNFHPLVNTESLGIGFDDLLTLIRSCGQDALVVSLGGMAARP